MGHAVFAENQRRIQKQPFRPAGGWPWNWAWENYGSVFRTFAIPVEAGAGSRDVYFLEMMWYSLLYAVGCSFAATFVASIVAYLVAKFPYKFSKVVYTIVIVAMILPIVGSLPSEIQMARALDFSTTSGDCG